MSEIDFEGLARPYFDRASFYNVTIIPEDKRVFAFGDGPYGIPTVFIRYCKVGILQHQDCRIHM